MFLFACDARAHIYWPMSGLQPIILVPGSFHLNWGMGLEDQKNYSTFEVAVFLGFLFSVSQTMALVSLSKLCSGREARLVFPFHAQTCC